MENTEIQEQDSIQETNEDEAKAARRAERKHKRDLEKSGLSLKRPLKKGKISPLTNPAVRESLLAEGGTVAAQAQQEINESHDKMHPFISARGELKNLTIQNISPPEMDGVRSSINSIVNTFDGFNQALFNDSILRPDNKRGRLGTEAVDVHKKIADLLSTEIDKQESITNDFNTWLQAQIKITDTVEQLMGAEIRQRTESLKPHELRKLSEENPTIAKAVINDPLSKLEHSAQVKMIDTFLASIDKTQLDKRDTANKNIEWLMSAVEHFDTKIRGVYQTPEMAKLMEDLKRHGNLAGQVQRRNSGGGAISQNKRY